ncbi:hypothetical protein B0H16DRAFT_1473560 [Mycena metata]|uniref:Uncharacterized protein n=1 Tax=Mycena metata TaxID=1033252 RepID=A0AAD7HKL7_9AGAR|nr:hypothetical protein B0H16DRAFT_1473560 [Mycena metata]
MCNLSYGQEAPPLERVAEHQVHQLDKYVTGFGRDSASQTLKPPRRIWLRECDANPPCDENIEDSDTFRVKVKNHLPRMLDQQSDECTFRSIQSKLNLMLMLRSSCIRCVRARTGYTKNSMPQENRMEGECNQFKASSPILNQLNPVLTLVAFKLNGGAALPPGSSNWIATRGWTNRGGTKVTEGIFKSAKEVTKSLKMS